MWENNCIHFPPSLPSPCLFRHFHNLQNLSLAYCRKFTDKGLRYLNLGDGCHKLIYLDLSGCTQVCLFSPPFPAAGEEVLRRAGCIQSPCSTNERCAQAAAHFSEVLSYTATAAYIFPRIAAIGSWLPSTGVSHPQPGRAHWMMKQTTSGRYSEQLVCQSPNLEILKNCYQDTNKGKLFWGRICKELSEKSIGSHMGFQRVNMLQMLSVRKKMQHRL